MTSLADKVYQLITGEAPTPLGGWLDQANELILRRGSLTAAAKYAGVDRRTYQRWYEHIRAGKTPKPRPGTLAKLEASTRRARVGTLPDPKTVVIHTEDRDSGRNRTISGRQLRLRDDTMRQAADAWIATGDPEAAGAAFLAGVGDSWYREYLRPRESVAEPVDEDEDGTLYELVDDDEFPDYYEDVDGEEVFGPDADSYGAEVTG